MVMVPALTGLRIGEVLGLTWGAVDLKSSKLSVRTKLADSDKGQPSLLRPPKTKSSRRAVSLPAKLVLELKVWKLKCPKSGAKPSFRARGWSPPITVTRQAMPWPRNHYGWDQVTCFFTNETKMR